MESDLTLIVFKVDFVKHKLIYMSLFFPLMKRLASTIVDMALTQA